MKRVFLLLYVFLPLCYVEEIDTDIWTRLIIHSVLVGTLFVRLIMVQTLLFTVPRNGLVDMVPRLEEW